MDIEEKTISPLINSENYATNFFYFQNRTNKYNLFGVDYIPTVPNDSFLIFLQPIATERNVIDAVQVNLARMLAAKGTRVLRFDYFGTGDSDGSFENVDYETMISDIDSAVAYCNEKKPNSNIGLLGIRFGALLAGVYAERHVDTITNLILCAPIIDAHEYIMNELRQSLSTQTVLFKKIIMNREQIVENLLNNSAPIIDNYNLSHMNGYPLSKEFYTSFKDITLKVNHQKYKNDCLIINIDKLKRKKNQYEEIIYLYKSSCRKFEYHEIIEKALPWIHNNRLFKIYPPLNSIVFNWI